MRSSKLGTYLAESLAGLATPKEKLDVDAPAPGAASAGAPKEKAEEDGAALVPAPKEKSDAAALTLRQ